jgi:hypothetical protein
MSKSILFSSLVASALIFSSCNNTEQSSDLELVSKNLDAAFAHNQSGSSEISAEINNFFMIHNTELINERKEKIQSTLDKISELEKQEKKALDIVDKQIVNNEKDMAMEIDQLNTSANDFLKVINSKIEKNLGTEVALNEITSTLDLSTYKLNGTKKENTLALKSIKLAISNAYFRSVHELRMMISLTSPADSGKYGVIVEKEN